MNGASMPIKSKQQLKMMFAKASNGSLNNKYGPSKQVAQEMLAKTPSITKSKLMRNKL